MDLLGLVQRSKNLLNYQQLSRHRPAVHLNLLRFDLVNHYQNRIKLVKYLLCGYYIDSPLELIHETFNVGVWILCPHSVFNFKIAKCGPRPAKFGTFTVALGRAKGCTVDRSKSESAKAIVDVIDIPTQLLHDVKIETNTANTWMALLAVAETLKRVSDVSKQKYPYHSHISHNTSPLSDLAACCWITWSLKKSYNHTRLCTCNSRVRRTLPPKLLKLLCSQHYRRKVSEKTKKKPQKMFSVFFYEDQDAACSMTGCSMHEVGPIDEFPTIARRTCFAKVA